MIFNINLGGKQDNINDLFELSEYYLNYTTRSIPNYFFMPRSDAFSVTFLRCEQIGSHAFEATQLTSISFPNCEYIHDMAFRYCINLTGELSLSKCSIFGTGAFERCSKITEIYLPQCRVIGSECFSSCINLAFAYLPECVEIYDSAFYSNTSLPQIDLGKIKHLGQGAFVGCTQLSWVILGRNLEPSETLCLSRPYIFDLTGYAGSFNLYLPSTKIVQLDTSSLFYLGASPRSYYIYVPEELLESYQTATNWVSVSSHFQILPSTL